MSDLHEWDAQAYQRLSEPQFAWGLRVLERLPLDGTETVVDAGCGSGRLTMVVAKRLPRGHVIAVDRSANMIAEARGRIAALGDRVSFVCADLTTFVTERRVDAVFSTATFHWLHDHDRLFESVASSLVDGGRLVAQCGGDGNLERFHGIAEEVYRSERFARWFDDFEPTWNFQPPDATAARLRASGFVDVRCALLPAPTPFPDRPTFAEFVRTVVLRAHLARLPDEEVRKELIEAVVERVASSGALLLDYVRLDIDARRAA